MNTANLPDIEVVERAYVELRQARTAKFEAGVEEATADWQLKRRRAHAVQEGTITGKNDDQRAASERLVLMDAYQQLHNAQATLAGANLRFDLAQYEVDRIRLLVRLVETRQSAVVVEGPRRA